MDQDMKQSLGLLVVALACALVALAVRGGSAAQAGEVAALGALVLGLVGLVRLALALFRN